MRPSLDRFVRFPVPSTPDALAALRVAMLACIAADPEPPVVVELDDLVVLDSATIATLVRLGRDVRERGGSMGLAGGSTGVVATLRVTALDRVFEVVERSSPDPAGSAATNARRAQPRIAGAVTAALGTGALLLATASSAASETPSARARDLAPREIVANVIAQNPQMRSYEAQLSVDLHLKSFPWLSQHLDATTYFKRPDNYEVVFHDVPSYAKGFEKLYSDIDDPSGWDRRYTMAVVGERQIAGRTDVVVRLVQRVRGMIDHQDVAIDVDHWRIDEMEWHYYNGGEIAMTQDYVAAGPFFVLAAQHATIRIPHVSASAEASYTGYHTNVPIDDSVFAKSAGQAAK